MIELKKYSVTVDISAADQDQADGIRSEIAQSLEDARDSGEFDFPFEADVGDLVEDDTSDAALLFAAVMAVVRGSLIRSMEPLQALGFKPHHTGGGCMALAYFAPDGSHVMLTDHENASIPENMDHIMVSHYDADEDLVPKGGAIIAR